MFEIKTYNAIAPEGLNSLNADQFVLNSGANPDGIILRSEKLHGMEFPESLKAIARAGAGVNNVPVEECSEAGVVVFNTPGANANAVKELVLAAMIMAARPIKEGLDWVQTLSGDDVEKQVEKGKSQFAGTEISGKTLGVIGLGAIGAMLANDAFRLGMEVIGYDPYVSVETAWNINRRVQKAASIAEVLAKADYISIHVPVNAETKGMVDAAFLAQMKDNAVLLNFARGELVNTADMLAALKEKCIRKYVTDFADEALLHNDDIIVMPHLGASTEEAEVNCAIMAAQTLKYFLETGNIVNSVNFPGVDIAMHSPIRITVINKNIPNMVGQISSGLAKYFINIEDILNRSRGNYAYTVIDIAETDQAVLDEVVENFKKIDGIVNVRVIRR
ncbi:D-3-phosphoglycerate dehydrogenase [Trichococcus flocculiformis]|uniref:phosphoglycerate dehydrogenase n=1 Tax=Trichococcus TaxID=82802 RepID=UPI0007A7F9AE|nr:MULTISPECIES: phosphoglycerate dehydrogenase [Trichococcus]CZQ96166.1 d-isomer specific 2-hydroxyacid dehydrogenases signature 3 [Trichococcus sp. ES5]SHF53022.1 D-3-phosphoglycerate dehydrogenase [Trichococcus flocculiformis]